MKKKQPFFTGVGLLLKSLFVFVTGLLFVNSVNAQTTTTFSFASTVYNTTTKGYDLTDVGTYFKGTTGGTISDGSTNCNGFTPAKATSSTQFIFLPTITNITKITVNGTGTGSNRTFTNLSTSTALDGTYTIDGGASGTGTISGTTCGSIVITPGTPILAGTYFKVLFSGNLNITSIDFEHTVSAAVVTTTTATNISFTTATTGGNVTSNGGAPITERGIVYSSTNTTPAIGTDTKLADAATTVGAFVSNLTGLTSNTTYYVRSYAINSAGTSYGEVVTFKTLEELPTLTGPASEDFGSININKKSPEHQIAISGIFLTPGGGTITITAPAGFLISATSGSGYTSSITIPYTGNGFTATIYAIFAPTVIGPVTGNIVLSGGGAPNTNIAVLGEGTPTSLQSTQGFSNKGTEFWTGFGLHEKINDAGVGRMKLYFTADATPAVVNIYVGTTLIETVNVPANSIKGSSLLPDVGTPNDPRLYKEADIYAQKGIHIVSDVPIVAYAQIFGSKVSATTILFPVNTLGRSYTALNYEQRASGGDEDNLSYAFAIATEDNTQIKVTMPATAASKFIAAGGTDTKTLNKGDAWMIAGLDQSTDLTGTLIQSISNDGSSCKPIAVFSGSGKIGIVCGAGVPSSDNLFQQAFPSAAWGKKYITAPTSKYVNNVYRVMASADKLATTSITVNGAAVTIPSGLLYYEFTTDQPAVIESTEPVMVAQYITNPSRCNNPSGDGDPDMIYLSSIEQTIDKIIVSPVESDAPSSQTNYINVVIKTSDVANFSIKDQNGNPLTVNFVTIPGVSPSYSYAQVQLANGYSESVFYTLQSLGAGFNAIAYGYAPSESYAYNAGTNVRDLYSGFGFTNEYGTDYASEACRGSKVNLRVALPYPNTSQIIWDYTGVGNNITPNKSDTMNLDPNQINYESSFISAGKTLYVFKNPTAHVFTSTGTFPIKVFAQNPTGDGCGLQQFNFNITVNQGPVADFSFTAPQGCATVVPFTDLSNGSGGTLNRWVWNFGDNTPIASDSTIQNPTHTYTSGGTFPVTLRAITQEGCWSDVTKNISLTGVPVADFTTNPEGCINVNQTFTDNSSISSGSLTGWEWTFGDNTPTVVSPTNAAQQHQYVSATTYNVTLKVTTAVAGCFATVTKPVIINNPPSVNAGQDVTTLVGVPVTLTGIADGVSFAWTPVTGLSTPQSLTTVATPGVTTTYKLTATTAAGCVGSDEVVVTVNGPCLDPKNAFTPNNDGSNDKWIVSRGDCLKKLLVDVYNRWGGLVYHSDNYTNNWDGTYKAEGKAIPDATYYYIIKATYQDGRVELRKGNVTIMR